MFQIMVAERKRLVLVGSLLGNLDVVKCNMKTVTVRMAIGKMEDVSETKIPFIKFIPDILLA